MDRRGAAPHTRRCAARSILALAIRLVFLGVPIRLDEADTVTRYAGAPLRRTISDYSFPNNHILHSIAVKVPMALFGSAPWSVRLPALIAGLLLVPLIYAVGRAFYGSAAGLIAATLAAASAPLRCTR